MAMLLNVMAAYNEWTSLLVSEVLFTLATATRVRVLHSSEFPRIQAPKTSEAQRRLRANGMTEWTESLATRQQHCGPMTFPPRG